MSAYTDHPSGGAARPDHPAGDDNWWETAGAIEPHASSEGAAGAAGANIGAGALRPGTAAASILARAFRNRPAQPAEDNAATAKKPCGVERLLRSIAADYGTHALVLEALIEILVKKGLVTEDEFEELLGDIDARDGRLDGTLGDPNYQLGDGI